MAKEFCQKCNYGTVYDFTKPKFCAECGSPFGSFASVPTPRKIDVRPSRVLKREELEDADEDNYDGEDGDDSFSNFSPPEKFDYEIIGPRSNQSSIRSLMSNPANDNIPSSPKKKLSKVEEKKLRSSVLEEFKREAGSMSRSPSRKK